MLKIISHPKIIDIYEILEDDKNHYQVQELAPHGNLYDHIVKFKGCKLREEDVKNIAR